MSGNMCVGMEESKDRSVTERFVGTVAVVWRGSFNARPSDTRNYHRLRPVFEAMSEAGVAVEPVLYRDAAYEAARDRLVSVDGVLVWVDPIGEGEDRTTLDAVLREVSSRGVWVSAHPDTIEKMGTKEVLYRTRSMGWGTETHLYATVAEFRDRFPAVLGRSRSRVLKPNRGNGGIGVWKVTLVDGPTVGDDWTVPTSETVVRVQHAAPRDEVTEEVRLGEFIDRCDQYFSGGAKVIDQPFITRVTDGMVRVYLVRDGVVGYARQYPAARPGDTPEVTADRVLGLPSAKTMYAPDTPAFQALRTQLEDHWVAELCALVGLDRVELPLLWDADFLFGPPAETSADTYLLCEINVSSVLPYPDAAPEALAAAVRDRLTASR
jgi:hypothetical protein